MLRLLPMDSRFFGPPRHETSCARYPRKELVLTTRVHPAEHLPAAAPIWFGPPLPEYIPPESACEIRHALEVFELASARVLGPDAHPVAPGDHLLTDSAWRQSFLPPNFSNRSIMRRRRPYPKVRLRGRVALIGSCWSGGSFAHFAADALPRWKLLLEAGHRAEEFDHMLIYHPRTSSSRVLIKALDLGPKVVDADLRKDYVCDELVFTSHPHLTPRYTPELVRFVQNLLSPRNPVRRIYLSRKGYSRHPANSDDLERLLAARGFEIIDGADHLGALHACREAAVVVGVEGSNLFNTLLCPAGTKIVILLWPECPFSYIASLGAALDHPSAIIAPSSGATSQEAAFPLEHVAGALDWALRPSPDET